MNNKTALKYFEILANTANDVKATKINTCNDFSKMDAEFILQFADRNSDVLDLACGTGITINKYYSKVKSVLAVEKFEKLTRFIAKADNIEVVISDIFDYEPQKKFDIITMFGIMHYVSEVEAKFLYNKYKKYLKNDGKLIIKQQFGLHEDVNVCGYSAELNRQYYSIYRTLEHEIDILTKENYQNIKIFDIYPAHCNRWENTHFYAIVASL